MESTILFVLDEDQTAWNQCLVLFSSELFILCSTNLGRSINPQEHLDDTRTITVRINWFMSDTSCVNVPQLDLTTAATILVCSVRTFSCGSLTSCIDQHTNITHEIFPVKRSGNFHMNPSYAMMMQRWTRLEHDDPSPCHFCLNTSR